jgi:2-polyprenyl-3-methyl-5-hydroxy-6-metoxy-1,4-benzoquinol methylase
VWGVLNFGAMATQVLKSHYEQKYVGKQGESTAITAASLPMNRYEAAVSFIPKFLSGGNVLELGCGDGRVAEALLKSSLPITSYTLSDLVIERVAETRQRLNDPRVQIAEIDAESVVSAAKYDLIVMVALIEHLIDPLRAMRNLRSLLNPGGMVYIDTPNLAKFTRRLKLLFGRFPSTATKNEGLTCYDGTPVDLYDEGHLHYFTYRSLNNLLISYCGYASTMWLGYPMQPFLINRRIHGLLANAWPSMFSEICMLAYA